MISVCLDTTLTTTKCNRYSFRPFDYAPSQAVAFAPYLVGKLGKRWHIAFADYSWGQSTRDAYVEQIKKAGGEIVGTTGIPLGTADMTPFLSKITGDFDGLFGIFFGKDGVTIGNQAFDLGLTRKYKWAGDGAIAESTNLPALGNKIEGFVGINRYVPLLEGPLNTPYHKRFFDEAKARLKAIDSSGPDPDRYVQSNYEAMNALKLGMEKSKFRGREDTDKLIAALEGLEMKEGDDFPQGDKTLRKEDHQAFLRQFIVQIKGGKPKIVQVVDKDKTRLPAGLQVRLSEADTSAAIASPAHRPGRRDRPCAAHRGADDPLRRPDRAQQRQFRAPARGDPRHHRPERRRQEHVLQLPDRRAAPDLGAHHVQRRGHHRPAAERISRKGIARSYQITNILPNATVLENVRIAAQSRRHAWSMLPHHSDFRDIIDKAQAVLASVGLAGKADELAANLSHGEQRNLEIGIALATEPQLLCLDEPTAGMSAAETHDTMALVRRIAKDLTILIVEHDMQVVMELAQRITVLHYGEVLAEGTPAEIQQNPRVLEVYLKT